jgi:hypothetical protein
MRALDTLSKDAGTDGTPLNAAAVRARCEGGDRDACLVYGLMAVRRASPAATLLLLSPALLALPHLI